MNSRRVWLTIYPVLALGALGCATSQAMRVDSDRPGAVVEAYFRAAQREDLDAVVALFTPEAVYEDVTFEFRVRGHDALRGMFSSAFTGMRAAHRVIERMVSEDQRVVIEWRATGTHTGPVLGVAATLRPLTIRAVSIIEVEGGRITRVTDYTDRAGLEAQLRRPPDDARGPMVQPGLDDV